MTRKRLAGLGVVVVVLAAAAWRSRGLDEREVSQATVPEVIDLIGVRNPESRRWTAEIVTRDGKRHDVAVELIEITPSERRSGRLRALIGPESLAAVVPQGVRRGVGTLSIRGGDEGCAFAVAIEARRPRD